jgi:Flp pilus assembly pilin Flp
MFDVLKKLVRDEAGQDLAEYGIALAVIAAGVGLIVLAVGTGVNNLWNRGNSVITQAAS